MNGKETSKFNHQQVCRQLETCWLDFWLTRVFLLRHLAQFTLCRIEIFFIHACICLNDLQDQVSRSLDQSIKINHLQDQSLTRSSLICWKTHPKTLSKDSIAVLERDGEWEEQKPLSCTWWVMVWKNKSFFLTFYCNSSYVVPGFWIRENHDCMFVCLQACVFIHTHAGPVLTTLLGSISSFLPLIFKILTSNEIHISLIYFEPTPRAANTRTSNVMTG